MTATAGPTRLRRAPRPRDGRASRAARRRAEQAGALDRPTVSFELFPPRNPDAAPRLWETVRELESVEPDFVSVTYGASGQDPADHTRARPPAAARDVALPDRAPDVRRDVPRGGHDDRRGVPRRGRALVPRAARRPARRRAGLAAAPRRRADRRRARRAPAGHRVAAAAAAAPPQAVRARVRPLSVAVAAFPRGNHADRRHPRPGRRRPCWPSRRRARTSRSRRSSTTPRRTSAWSPRRAPPASPSRSSPGIIPTTDPARLLRVAGAHRRAGPGTPAGRARLHRRPA